jgi:hypothetical protein
MPSVAQVGGTIRLPERKTGLLFSSCHIFICTIRKIVVFLQANPARTFVCRAASVPPERENKGFNARKGVHNSVY